MSTKETSSKASYAVGILGATGAVGQQFILLLLHHPWFRISRLAASSKWEGHLYKNTQEWRLNTPLPETISNLKLVPCCPSYFEDDCDLIFSALDSKVARDIEMKFSMAGFPVFSNAVSHRRDPNVPILSPYVNPDHLDLVFQQKAYHDSGGFIVTNSNCAVSGLSLLLAALRSNSCCQIDKLFVVTLQAISGAGYPGLSSWDISHNVIPCIQGEEEKIEYEPRKMLGSLRRDADDRLEIQMDDIQISAMCHRVDVLEGHTLTVSLNSKQDNLDVLNTTLLSFKPSEEIRSLPSCPEFPIVYEASPHRPQPRRDVHQRNGMSIIVGPLRPCTIYTAKVTFVVHNTILGAAGGSIFNAELATLRGLTQREKLHQTVGGGMAQDCLKKRCLVSAPE